MFEYEFHCCGISPPLTHLLKKRIFSLMLFLCALESNILQIGNLFTFSLAKHCLDFGLL